MAERRVTKIILEVYPIDPGSEFDADGIAEQLHDLGDSIGVRIYRVGTKEVEVGSRGCAAQYDEEG